MANLLFTEQTGPYSSMGARGIGLLLPTDRAEALPF